MCLVYITTISIRIKENSKKTLKSEIAAAARRKRMKKYSGIHFKNNAFIRTKGTEGRNGWMKEYII